MIKDLLLLTIFPAAMALRGGHRPLHHDGAEPDRLRARRRLLRGGAIGRARLVRCRAARRARRSPRSLWPSPCSRLAGSAAATPSCSPPPAFGSVPQAIFTYSLYTALIGGALTLVLLFWRGLAAAGDAILARLARPPAQPKRGRALRHRARRGRTARLSRDTLYGRARRLTPPRFPVKDFALGCRARRHKPPRSRYLRRHPPIWHGH